MKTSFRFKVICFREAICCSNVQTTSLICHKCTRNAYSMNKVLWITWTILSLLEVTIAHLEFIRRFFRIWSFHQRRASNCSGSLSVLNSSSWMIQIMIKSSLSTTCKWRMDQIEYSAFVTQTEFIGLNALMQVEHRKEVDRESLENL